MVKNSDEIIKKLSKSLMALCIWSMNDIFGPEEIDMNDLINIALSAHISALFKTMMVFGKDNEEIENNVKKFKDNLLGFISTQLMIKDVKDI